MAVPTRPLQLAFRRRACKALVDGNAEELGKLMNEAQAAFFKYATPACPSQLTMPLLQKVSERILFVTRPSLDSSPPPTPPSSS